MSKTEHTRAIVEAAYAAMVAGDPRGFLSALDPDVVVHEPAGLPYGGTYHGLGGLQQMFGKAAGVLDPTAMEVLHVVADGERAVALLQVGLASGATALVSEHWRFEEGRAVELRVFWDDPSAA